MGNDMDVMSKDEKLHESFWRNVGPEDESTYQFFQRGMDGFSDKLVNPKRSSYTDDDLNFRDFERTKFSVLSEGVKLEACHWGYVGDKAGGGADSSSSSKNNDNNSSSNNNNNNNNNSSSSSSGGSYSGSISGSSGGIIGGGSNIKSILSSDVNSNINSNATSNSLSKRCRLCVLYLHTNTRNMSDASEIIPFCNRFHADIVAFDLPGCGKSGGSLSAQMFKDICSVFDWVRNFYSEDFEFVVWGRGMACSPALEFWFNVCESKEKEFDLKKKFKGLVLDTPFESIKSMVDQCLAKLQVNGYDLPTLLIPVFSRLVRYIIKDRIRGVDPYNIIPIDFILNSTPGSAKIPISILSASKDDYISPDHSLKFLSECQKAKVPCDICFFEQGHFGQRPIDIIDNVSNSLDRLSKLSKVEVVIPMASLCPGMMTLKKAVSSNNIALLVNPGLASMSHHISRYASSDNLRILDANSPSTNRNVKSPDLTHKDNNTNNTKDTKDDGKDM